MEHPQEGLIYTQEQPCGCKHGTNNGVMFYRPCLACALKNAGIMLQEAGLRLEESATADRAEQDRIKAKLKAMDEGFGGSD
jgi:hypothetical protein